MVGIRDVCRLGKDTMGRKSNQPQNADENHDEQPDQEQPANQVLTQVLDEEEDPFDQLRDAFTAIEGASGTASVERVGPETYVNPRSGLVENTDVGFCRSYPVHVLIEQGPEQLIARDFGGGVYRVKVKARAENGAKYVGHLTVKIAGNPLPITRGAGGEATTRQASAAAAGPDAAIMQLEALSRIIKNLSPAQPSIDPLQMFGAVSAMHRQIREDALSTIVTEDDDEGDDDNDGEDEKPAPPADAGEGEEQEDPAVDALMGAIDGLEIPNVWKNLARKLVPTLVGKQDKMKLVRDYLVAYANGQIPPALLAQTIQTQTPGKFAGRLGKLAGEKPEHVAAMLSVLFGDELGNFYKSAAGLSKIAELQAAMKGGS